MRPGWKLLALVGLTSSCGGSGSGTETVDSSDGSETIGPNGVVVEVDVLDNSFRPIDVTIAAGTRVTFTNVGRNEHNILPDSIANDDELTRALADTSNSDLWGVASTDLPPGASYSHDFLAPGKYSFYCSIHGVPGKGMFGTLTVT